MFKKLVFAFLILIGFLFVGCASIDSINDTWERMPDRLQSEVFNSSSENVYNAAKMTILNLGLALESESVIDKTKVLYARSPANMTKVILTGQGRGELVGIFMTPVSDNKTKVDVVVQKAYKMEYGYTDYRGLVLNQIKTLLKL